MQHFLQAEIIGSAIQILYNFLLTSTRDSDFFFLRCQSSILVYLFWFRISFINIQEQEHPSFQSSNIKRKLDFSQESEIANFLRKLQLQASMESFNFSSDFMQRVKYYFE